MPPTKDVFQRYLRKFSKNGKLFEQDLGLTTEAPAERCRFIVNCAESLATELSASQLTASQAASSACHAALPAIQLNL